MPFLLRLLLLSVLTFPAAAQQTLPAALPEYNAQRTLLDQRGMRVLGAWAVGNVGISGARAFATDGPEKYFHQMNVGWGVVNLALAGSALVSARHTTLPTDRASTAKAQLHTENLYLLNTGLDVAYVATGFYLKERARSRSTQRQQDRLTGYGRSLLLQGGFLFAFDGLMFAAHHAHGKSGLYPLLSHVQAGPNAIAFVVKL
ncbi:DUF6992 family protein [Hymenobacter volaticus]|uniref:DUF5683 domain-containing protein n=1 Tax=Hymenobacter volaticus TaxID=2932254 RepID=A0ABY4G6T7_9BACT|nr:hypothetical protein [Hymenobacter volaticus]UOQ66583.1 hypothetical protein MUN86_01225 [Hymenobacter volaticus]